MLVLMVLSIVVKSKNDFGTPRHDWHKKSSKMGQIYFSFFKGQSSKQTRRSSNSKIEEKGGSLIPNRTQDSLSAPRRNASAGVGSLAQASPSTSGNDQ